MRAAILLLREQFGLGFIWNMLNGPYLAMRMRIAGPHHGAAILKDLHIVHFSLLAQLRGLRSPRFHHTLDVLRVHPRQRQIVVWMKTHYPAGSTLELGAQYIVVRNVLYVRKFRYIRQQRSVIVVKNKNAVILGISMAARARISGA